MRLGVEQELGFVLVCRRRAFVVDARVLELPPGAGGLRKYPFERHSTIHMHAKYSYAYAHTNDILTFG